MEKLSVAIIGAGRMGRIRASLASRLGASVKYVFDSDPKRSHALAATTPGCLVLPNEQVPWDIIDAVFVCTPPARHRKFTVDAVSNGVHVFIEKPLANSLSEANEMFVAARTSQSIVAVGYMNRYRDNVQTILKILKEDGPIGFSSHWVCKEYGVDWWKDSLLSGGSLNEQGCHYIDLNRYLGGEIDWVSCSSNSTVQGSLAHTYAVTFGFASGGTGVFFYSCKGTEKDIAFNVHHARGALKLSGWDMALHTDGPQAIGTIPPEDADALFLKETTAFFEAITTSNTSLIKSDIGEALCTQEVLEAAHLSIHSGKRIAVGSVASQIVV